ncbi:aspartate/glutamate racemase family protein [Gordonia otitidis]|nr:aspartate/glutamate racemase family protein [Gordonia otitidis]
MQRVLVINPNSSPEMTESIAWSARSGSEGVHVDVVSIANAPAGINDSADERAAVNALTNSPVLATLDDNDRVILACFGDPGVAELQQITTTPVVGIAKQTLLEVARVHGTFAILAASAAAEMIMKSLVADYGLDSSCRGVVSVGLDAETLALGHDEHFALIEQRVMELVADSDAACVVLGCTALGPLSLRLSSSAGIPVIDAVHTAVRLAAPSH